MHHDDKGHNALMRPFTFYGQASTKSIVSITLWHLAKARPRESSCKIVLPPQLVYNFFFASLKGLKCCKPCMGFTTVCFTLTDVFGSHNGAKFSTSDQSVDRGGNSACARDNRAGWWYFPEDNTKCGNVNLNGPCGHIRNLKDSFSWPGFPKDTMLRSRMLVKRRVV